MQPLVISLDTNDYIRLFNKPDDETMCRPLEELLAFRDRGDVVIGYDWVTIIEFITKPAPGFLEERAARGRLLKKICGRNAFPSINALLAGATFPNNGDWFGDHGKPVLSAKEMRARMRRYLKEEVEKQPSLNRQQRRKLKTPSGFREVLGPRLRSFGTKRSDFGNVPVSKEILESNLMGRFLAGEVSDAEFESRLNQWVSDPEELSRIAYDYGDVPNAKSFFTKSTDKMQESFRNILSVISEIEHIAERQKKLRSNLVADGLKRSEANKLVKIVKAPDLNLEEMSAKLTPVLGDRSDHFIHFIRQSISLRRQFKESDYFDLMRMVYVPDCDFFRCDRAMAGIFRDYEPFKGKLVNRFEDLPGKIEDKLAKRAAVGGAAKLAP